MIKKQLKFDKSEQIKINLRLTIKPKA